MSLLIGLTVFRLPALARRGVYGLPVRDWKLAPALTYCVVLNGRQSHERKTQTAGEHQGNTAHAHAHTMQSRSYRQVKTGTCDVTIA